MKMLSVASTALLKYLSNIYVVNGTPGPFKCFDCNVFWIAMEG